MFGRRSFRVCVFAAVAVTTMLSSASHAAALDSPPWPPPAPTPPFPPLNPTPGQLPASAGSAARPVATTATAPPDAAPAAAPTAGVLKVGSTGAAVTALQQRLKSLAYDPGPINGSFGAATQFAVFAFEKVQGMKPSGIAGPLVLAALNNPKGPPVLAGGGDRVEIDIARQLLMTYKGGALVLISHISSGSGKSYCENGHCGTAITPRGTFSILWSRSGWETAPLGRLYNPQYFTTAGHAIHGSASVPLYPASHGCVRIPMHTAAWFPSLVAKGTPVIVR